MKTRTKESRKRLKALILLTAFTCILLIVSTYAWFTVQKDVTISNIRGKVEVAEGLQVSLDAKTWTQTIDLESADATTKASLTTLPGTDGVVFGPYSGNTNHVPDEFKPVSASGETTADNKELSMVAGNAKNKKKLETIAQCDETETDVNESDYAGYYAFDMFLLNASKTGVTSETLQLDSTASAWVIENDITVTDGGNTITYVGNADSGLQNTIRVAFARFGDGVSGSGVVPSTATQSDALDTIGDQTISAVSIWEPNHDKHTEYILANVKPMITPTVDFTSAFFTKTVKKGINSLENVYDWSNTNLSEPKTVQTTATSASGTINPYINEGVTDLTTIDTTPVDFTIAANSITKVRVYIYMEGQDPDCDNFASHGGGIEVNLGLTKGETEGTKTHYNDLVAATP